MKNIFTLFILVLSIVVNAQCWNKVASGSFHSLAILSDNSLWSWGNNEYRQLGLGIDWSVSGFEALRNIPVRVGNENDWKEIDCGYWYSAAIKENGTLWMWGSNEQGQLGNGTYEHSYIPIQIGFDNKWKQVFVDMILHLRSRIMELYGHGAIIIMVN